MAMAAPATPPTPAPDVASAKPAGRWFIALGFVLSSLTTAGLGYIGQRYYLDYQNQQNDLFGKIAAFEKQSGDLPNLVSALNRQLIARKSAQKERDAVASNAREQYRTLNDALPYVPADQLPEAQNYLTIMANLSQEVQKVTSPLNAGPFLQEFEYAAVARDRVVNGLRQAAGLPIVPEAGNGNSV